MHVNNGTGTGCSWENCSLVYKLSCVKCFVEIATGHHIKAKQKQTHKYRGQTGGSRGERGRRRDEMGERD